LPDRRRTIAFAAALVATATLSFTAEERIDSDINARIRQEGQKNSQIMRTLHFLTDVYGPRVTGTPSLKAAGEWAVQQMEAWGLTNGHLEPWDFGHPGWTNDFASAAILSPVKDKLEFEVLAWTPGTNGVVNGRATNIVLPDQPTVAELTTYFDSIRSQVKNAMVLVGTPRSVPVEIEPPAKRRPDEQVKLMYDPTRTGDGRGGRGGRGVRGAQSQREGVLSAAEVTTRLDQFLLSGGASLRINDAARAHGLIAAYNSRGYDPAKTVPTVVMRNEDYGRIARILADGTPVELQFNIVNKTYPEGVTAYNAIAEIPGSDKKDEVVMLGGHLDSWHSATGATDNAIGCAMMMEAARILKSLGVQPRRTIRVALWSGEEQGLLGSLAYVAQHFGSFENPKPEFDKLVAYLNVDTGTGRVRGAGVFGPPEVAQPIREMLKPFEDLGVFGASATVSRSIGGTDSTSFNNAGLIGIGFNQDPIEYNTHTHHTNLDTYERVIEQDVRQSAVVIASVLYHLSMRDEPLPRFDKATMPPPPVPRGQ
jgi:carboxypeptidase Q